MDEKAARLGKSISKIALVTKERSLRIHIVCWLR